MRIQLPAGALVVLVGVSGSGKSTLAAGHFKASQVLSSDQFRELVADDPTDQSATEAAFALLHATLEARLSRGRLSVVDATSVERWAREQLIRLAHRHGRPAVAIVLDLPLATCLARNAARARGRVPEAAVRRQQRALQASLTGMEREGFDRLWVLSTAEGVDSLTIAGQRNAPKEQPPAPRPRGRRTGAGDLMQSRDPAAAPSGRAEE